MAKTKVSEFDATASNNTDINSVNVAEGCPPSGINNAIREMASLLKKQEVGTDAMTSPDIDGGTIDGATIGASSASTGAFTNLTASGTLGVSGATTITTADNTAQLTLVSTDTDANVGPILRLNRDSGSPADSDTIGSIVFNADNDASETTEYVRLLTFIGDASNGSEDAFIQSDYMIGGTLRNFYKIGGGELVFNEDGQDVNFRVEGSSVTDVIFVNAGDNDLHIGTGADLVTDTAGVNNTRIGRNAGNSIVSGGNYNVTVGDEAGTALTTGDENTFIGYASGDGINTGLQNVAVGTNSLSASGTATNNTAIGRSSMNATTGSENSALGVNTLATNVGGSHSVAIGSEALTTQNPSSGNVDFYNTAVGSKAGKLITTATQNTIIGGLAGDALLTGANVVAVGYKALSTDTKGFGSVAIGNQALENQNFTSNTDTFNTAVGYFAGNDITTGIQNVIIGSNAGDALTDADYNVAVGMNALSTDTQGSNSVAIGNGALGAQNFSSATNSLNVAVGNSAGAAVTTATSTTCLGHGAGSAVSTGTENICIGRDAGNHAISLSTGSSNIIIGTFADASATGATAQIVLGRDVTGSGNSNFTFGNGTTDSNIAFGATSITAPSDIRLKEDIKDETIGLEFINELRPVTFRWKKAKDVPSEMKAHSDSEERVMNGKYNHGFIAQEVKSVINKYDIKDGFGMWLEDEIDGRQRLAPSELIPMLVKAIQELSAEVTALKGE